MKNIMKGVVALAGVAILAGGAVAANATSLGIKGSGGASFGAKISNFLKADLTAEQKAALDAKIAAREKERAAERASLTAEQKTALDVKIAARQKQMTDKQAAIQKAIANNDYAAWVAAVGAHSYLATKITLANFAQYVQGYNLEVQADKIFSDLGIKGEGHEDFKGGLHLGLGINGRASSTVSE